MKRIVFFIFLAITSFTSAQENYTKILVNDQETNIISASKNNRIKIISNVQKYKEFDITCSGCKVTKKENYWIVVPSKPEYKEIFLTVSAKIDGEFYQIFKQSFRVE
jgi:hypothetical protein